MARIWERLPWGAFRRMKGTKVGNRPAVTSDRDQSPRDQSSPRVTWMPPTKELTTL